MIFLGAAFFFGTFTNSAHPPLTQLLPTASGTSHTAFAEYEPEADDTDVSILTFIRKRLRE